jgi:hypothetical protein
MLIFSRLLQFTAVIVVFGCGAFRVYGLGGDTAAAFPGALAVFDAWFGRVTLVGAIVALLSALTLLLAVTANMAGTRKVIECLSVRLSGPSIRGILVSEKGAP